MRSSTYRISKYASKIVGDVIKNRIDAQKDSMVEQVTNRFSEMAAKEGTAKGFLTGWGINTMEIPFYLSFVRQCYSILSVKLHTGSVAIQEICIRANAWAQRGLDLYYLQELAQEVFQTNITECTLASLPA